MPTPIVRVARPVVRVQLGRVPVAGPGGGGAVDSVDGRTGVVVLSDLYQPLDSDLTAVAALTTTAFGRALLELANAAAGRTALGAETSGAAAAAVASHEAAGDPHPGYLTEAAAAAGYQPLDSDLTAIAALTTTAFGRALLALADAAAGRTALELEHYTVVPLTADEANSTTTLAMSTELRFTPAAGAVYHVEYVIGYTSAATTTGIQHWLAPGNAADGGGWFAARGAGYTSQTVANPTLTGSFPVFGTSSGGGLTLAWGSAILVAAASSPTACGVEFASEIAASTVTLKQNCCFLRYRRLA